MRRPQVRSDALFQLMLQLVRTFKLRLGGRPQTIGPFGQRALVLRPEPFALVHSDLCVTGRTRLLKVRKKEIDAWTTSRTELTVHAPGSTRRENSGG